VIAASTGEEVTGRDADAFVALVEPVLPAAYRLAVGMLRSRDEAEDAVQEAMYRAWRSFGRFRGADMKPWLLTIVANQCRQMRRSRWWSVIRSDEDALTVPAARAEEENLGQTDLRRALQRLSGSQRLVLVLRYYLDLSFEEMAVILKTNPKAAKSRTYRALERLRLTPEIIGDD
jgi:RNA polymerase sigma-70 factor (ECF subfamily)